jgi:hypothetical protein
MKKLLTTIGMGALMLGIAAGCSKNSPSGPALDATATWNVAFNMDPNDGMTVGNGAEASEQALGGAPDSVTIETGAVVIRSLRLGNGNASADTNITASDQTRDAEDANIRFKGPYMASVAPATTELGTESVVSGRYHAVVFVLEPASSGIAGHPELDGKSVVVSGSVWRNGQASHFTFSTDYSSEFVVYGQYEMAAGSTCTGTLTFNPTRWFRSGAGWLDPTTPGNQVTVLRNLRSNIRTSFGVSETMAQ